MDAYNYPKVKCNGSSRLPAIWRRAEDAAATPCVAHYMPFVAQLIANAREISSPYRRRRTDRTGPLRAYDAAVTPASPAKATRLV